MKKLLCLLLTLAMTLSLAACGSKADDKTPEEDDPTQAETPSRRQAGRACRG